jgi:anti-sigma B factor antagonist
MNNHASDSGDRDDAPLRRELRPLGPVNLALTESVRSGATLISVSGEFDILTAPKVAALLDDVVRGRAGNVVVDLRGTEFLDSAGLHVLVNAKRRLTRGSRDLFVVVSPGGPVRRVLEVSRLAETLGAVTTLQDAGLKP